MIPEDCDIAAVERWLQHLIASQSGAVLADLTRLRDDELAWRRARDGRPRPRRRDR